LQEFIVYDLPHHNLFIQIVLNICILKSLLPLFCKTGTTHKTYILQEKQKMASYLHTTNTLRSRISPHILDILKDAIAIFFMSQTTMS